MPRPVFRWLRVFAFDPSRGKNFGNYMTLQVPFEHPLPPGPLGKYMAVIDYDPANQCYYEPVDLDDRWILANAGLPPTESDPRFHQQMVYAVVSETIQKFEYALGRPMEWSRRKYRRNSLFGRKLLVFPHGIQEANAFYDPELHALVFGYFNASDTDPGSNLPDQTIFTCLAHDVVAHETTHALLDSMRPAFMEPTNIDVAAFHEGFADIVALFQHFTVKEAVLEAIKGTRGILFSDRLSPLVLPGKDGAVTIGAQAGPHNPLVGMASQFGDAIGLHAPLRSAIGTPQDAKALELMTEPHDRGSILVAAVFDAFFTAFLKRTSDLWRIAGISRQQGDDVELHPDLVSRLCDEVSKTAGHFQTMCIRALDYCPPADITFGDYLRAIITADYDTVRDDDLGYRAALIDAFRGRGIRPESVTSYSEESLLWIPPEGERLQLKGLRRPDPNEPTKARLVNADNAGLLHSFAVANAEKFGLNESNSKHIAASAFRFVVRPNPDTLLPQSEMVAVILERLGPSKDNKTAPAVGGVTLLFNEDGTVRYAVRKSLRRDRAQVQAEFRQQLWESMPRGAYEDVRTGKIDFRALHQRY